jgi:hypothetical protein
MPGFRGGHVLRREHGGEEFMITSLGATVSNTSQRAGPGLRGGYAGPRTQSWRSSLMTTAGSSLYARLISVENRAHDAHHDFGGSPVPVLSSPRAMTSPAANPATAIRATIPARTPRETRREAGGVRVSVVSTSPVSASLTISKGSKVLAAVGPWPKDGKGACAGGELGRGATWEWLAHR